VKKEGKASKQSVAQKRRWAAQKTREACTAIGEGVTALRNILQISVAAGGGPIPEQTARKLDEA